MCRCSAKAKDIRRAVVSVARYVLRETARPTPFGLFAGVACVEFEPTAKARWGRGHRPFARVDAKWLADVITRLEACPPLLERLSVMMSSLRSVRGGRLVLPGGSGRVEIRYTAAVRAVERCAHSPEVLFAHQDAPLASAAETPRLLIGYRDLREAMTAVVASAQRYLAISGSRSRDTVYLNAIETTLTARPELVHYRVLFGPPRHPVLTDHLLRLLELRDPADRSLGKTLHIGMVMADPGTPERFFCASETSAVVPIPSLTSAEAFDSGVQLGAKAAERLIDHARQCYAAARRIETAQAIQALPVLRTPTSEPGHEGQT